MVSDDTEEETVSFSLISKSEGRGRNHLLKKLGLLLAYSVDEIAMH